MKTPEQLEFERYSNAVMDKLRAYGIETEQYDLGSISATFPGGEPVEFISRQEHDGGELPTLFIEPCIEVEDGTYVVDQLQRLAIMRLLHPVESSFGNRSCPEYVGRITDFQRKLVKAAKDRLASQGADALKAKYGVTEAELEFIEALDPDPE